MDYDKYNQLLKNTKFQLNLNKFPLQHSIQIANEEKQKREAAIPNQQNSKLSKSTVGNNIKSDYIDNTD